MGEPARRWRLVRARGDAVPESVRRFMVRDRQRRMRAARPWLIAAGLVVALGGSAFVIGSTPLLGVSRIEVKGATLVSPDEVRAAAAVRPGTPMARVATGRVGARVVAALPPVGRVTVTRSWPNTLVIRVVERTPLAVVPVGSGYGVLDAAGVIFQQVTTVPAGLPEVRLASPGPDDSTTRAALTVVASLPAPLRELMVALVAQAPTRIKLLITGGREVVWGDATDNELKARVALSFLASPGTVIDVSAPRVVTVK